MNRHEFYQLVNEQGQHRFARETFNEFQKRVLDLKEKREKHAEPWRTHKVRVASKK